jgi:hypothetical protein
MQYEVDALEPEDLRNLYRSVIAQFWNDDAYAEVLRIEERERRQL